MIGRPIPKDRQTICKERKKRGEAQRGIEQSWLRVLDMVVNPLIKLGMVEREIGRLGNHIEVRIPELHISVSEQFAGKSLALERPQKPRNLVAPAVLLEEELRKSLKIIELISK